MVNEETTVVTTVTATDPEVEDTLSYSVSGGTDAALFAINASTGGLSFLNAPDYEHPDDAGNDNTYEVQVTVTDNGTPHLSDVQTITVAVANVNEAPVAVDDSYTLLQGHTLKVYAGNGVLANDTNPENRNVLAQLESEPGNGVVSLASSGAFSYVHSGIGTAMDSFTYRIMDEQSGSSTATVTISFIPDADLDGVADTEDLFPDDPNENADADGDGFGDNIDAFPDNPNEHIDTDRDGIGNNADSDDDNDGIPDTTDEHPYVDDTAGPFAITASGTDGVLDGDVIDAENQDAMVFELTGGSGSFDFDITATPAGSGSPSVSRDGTTYTFVPSTFGAFAGEYTLVGQDLLTGEQITFTIIVPLRMTVSRTLIMLLQTDTTVTVRGAAFGDALSLAVLDSDRTEDSAGAIAILAQATVYTADDAANGNPAVTTLTPAQVSTFTDMWVGATNLNQPTLLPALSVRIRISPEIECSGYIQDEQGAPVTDALVWTQQLSDGDGIPYLARSDANGYVALDLPVGASDYGLVANHPDYLPSAFSCADLVNSPAVLLDPGLMVVGSSLRP